MQTIYLGPNRKVGDIDLKHNRIYTDRPEEIIEELKEKGFSLADKIFVAINDLNSAQEELAKPGTPIFVAAQQLRR